MDDEATNSSEADGDLVAPNAPTKDLKPLPAGSRLSHYEVVSVIGSGGMGLVYRAVDLSLGRDVALKCVRPDRSGNPDYHRRLRREAKAASRLSHPNIVTILEVFDHEDCPWIAMEFVDGASLRSVLKDQGPFSSQEFLRHAEELGLLTGV